MNYDNAKYMVGNVSMKGCIRDMTRVKSLEDAIATAFAMVDDCMMLAIYKLDSEGFENEASYLVNSSMGEAGTITAWLELL